MKGEFDKDFLIMGIIAIIVTVVFVWAVLFGLGMILDTLVKIFGG